MTPQSQPDFYMIRNYEIFQHYKHRNPPWIKVYNWLLDDPEFRPISDPAKLLYYTLLLYASRVQNRIPAQPKLIRDSCGVRTRPKYFRELIDTKYLVPYDASKALASCLQSACPEERQSREERETEKTPPPPSQKPQPKITPPEVPGVSHVSESLAQVFDGRPTGEQHTEIQELLESFRATWNLDLPPPAPAHDNLRRILEGLSHPALGLEGMKKAIRGHHKTASADNDRGRQIGRDFMHVFPPARGGGRAMSNRLDIDRVSAYKSAYRARPPGAAKPHRAAEKQTPKNEALKTGLKGIAQARAAIKETP